MLLGGEIKMRNPPLGITLFLNSIALVKMSASLLRMSMDYIKKQARHKIILRNFTYKMETL
jgi:hypothetical protein